MRTKHEITKIAFALIFAATFWPIITSARMNSENYIIEVDSLNEGGGLSTSTNYMLNDAFGEIATGFSTSTNYQEEPFISSYLFRFFSLVAPTTTSLSGKTISPFDQTATGTISGVEVIDDGTAGWSVTITFTHPTHLASTKLLSGSNNTVTFSGTYNGTYGIIDPPGLYIVEITTGGAVGAAQFKWTAPDGTLTTGSSTASSLILGYGISVNFASTTYVVGDKWSVAVDVFPYTGLLITPDTVAVINGDTGVSAGTAETLTGSGVSSDPKALMIGDSNNSTGTYQQNEDLELNVHANSLSGSFMATATLTVI